MRLVRAARENPVIVLSIGLTALIAWIAVDLFGNGSTKRDDGLHVLALQREFPLVGPPIVATEEEPVIPVGTLPSGTFSVAALPKLKAGMKRVEVESLLGPPAADGVHPVTLSDGRMTYRTAYELEESDTPMTIRPIKARPKVPSQPREPRAFIALEYDASKPGHPLLGVLYPDPLF